MRIPATYGSLLQSDSIRARSINDLEIPGITSLPFTQRDIAKTKHYHVLYRWNTIWNFFGVLDQMSGVPRSVVLESECKFSLLIENPKCSVFLNWTLNCNYFKMYFNCWTLCQKSGFSDKKQNMCLRTKLTGPNVEDFVITKTINVQQNPGRGAKVSNKNRVLLTGKDRDL